MNIINLPGYRRLLPENRTNLVDRVYLIWDTCTAKYLPMIFLTKPSLEGADAYTQKIYRFSSAFQAKVAIETSHEAKVSVQVVGKKTNSSNRIIR